MCCSGGLELTGKALSGLGVSIREVGQLPPPPPRSRARNPRLFGAAAQHMVSTSGAMPCGLHSKLLTWEQFATNA